MLGWVGLPRGGARRAGPLMVIDASGRDGQSHVPMPSWLYAQRDGLYTCALQLLDDPHAARQVTVEALAQAAVAVARGEASAQRMSPSIPGASVEPWLEASVVRLALVRLKVTPQELRGELVPSDDKKGSVRPRAVARVVADDSGDGADGGDPLDVVAQSSHNDTAGQLERAGEVLNSLLPEVRVIVTLVIMQGKSVAAAAALAGLSEETCAFYLSHGRKLLRRALQRDLVAADDVPGAGSILLSPRALHDLRGSKKATARA